MRTPALTPAARRQAALYSFGVTLALPVVALYLLWRSVRQREYRAHWPERFFGHGARFVEGARRVVAPGNPLAGPALAAPIIWIHAVSVGETRAAQPLIERLAHLRPELRFMLTHVTPTGRAVGTALAQAMPGRILQRYLPYDVPAAVARFLDETRPALGVLMETEVWPNLLRGAQAARVPVALVNARLSVRSLAKAQRFATLMRTAAAGLAGVAAQTEADRQRLARLYDGPIDVVGNLKFDLVPDPAQLARGRQLRVKLDATAVWLFASTREGEEALLLDALGPPPTASPGAPVVLVVPRHPQRFEEVARRIVASGWRLVRRSDATAWGRPVAPGTLLLGDSMGEMPMYYAMADVGLIGGSVLPLGGQNLIEAAACGCPVIFGPHMFNFEQAAADAVARGAALEVADAPAAITLLRALTADPARRADMCLAAFDYSRTHRGATERTAQWLLELLP